MREPAPARPFSCLGARSLRSDGHCMSNAWPLPPSPRRGTLPFNPTRRQAPPCLRAVLRGRIARARGVHERVRGGLGGGGGARARRQWTGRQRCRAPPIACRACAGRCGWPRRRLHRRFCASNAQSRRGWHGPRRAAAEAAWRRRLRAAAEAAALLVQAEAIVAELADMSDDCVSATQDGDDALSSNASVV